MCNAVDYIAMFAGWIVWFYLGGAFFLALNAFAHSDTNLGVHYAKKEKNYTALVQLRILQLIHCLLYMVWPVGFYLIFKLFN